MRVGTICFSTMQGIGWLNKWFYDEGVITDVVILRHGSRQDHPEWFPGAPIIGSRPFAALEECRQLVKNVDVLLFFETPFDWGFLNYCREQHKPTIVVPMYECMPHHIPTHPNKWICPSLIDVDYFPGSPFLPIPIPRGMKWELRKKATRFLHNGGNLGLRRRNGTFELLKSLEFIKSPIEITFRAQDTNQFERMMKEADIKNQKRVGDLKVSFDLSNTTPHDKLFEGFDVHICAEKFNGLSLPLQEARASGMLVMTSDRYPMNTWLPRQPLIPVASYSRQRVGGAFNEIDEALIRPEDIAAKIDEWHDQDITQYSCSGKEWVESMSWDKLKPLWLQELSV